MSKPGTSRALKPSRAGKRKAALQATNAGSAQAAADKPAKTALANFASVIANWQKQWGRHGLPWQSSHDAYRIWLSEIMLQQTQVSTVIAYYQRFLQRFPTLRALAETSLDDVMPYWAGLGYYTRARNLHRCARQVLKEHQGVFPRNPAQLEQLPGIGPSTASAIAAFAYGQRAPIMDGNVQRIFARYFGINADPSRQAGKTLFWEYAHRVLDAAPKNLDMVAYTQGQMDLGATLCRRSKPDCANCPLQATCHAHAHRLQAELPVRRARKKTPVRQCVMLLAQNPSGQFLLQKRPPSGIWGGLWSFPQFDDLQALQNYCQQQGLAPDSARPLQTLNHVFSHFSLQISPWLVLTAPPHNAQAAADAQANHKAWPFVLREGQASPQTHAKPAPALESPAGDQLPPSNKAKNTAAQAQAPISWMSEAEIQEAAVPAPVKTLLSALSA